MTLHDSLPPSVPPQTSPEQLCHQSQAQNQSQNQSQNQAQIQSQPVKQSHSVFSPGDEPPCSSAVFHAVVLTLMPQLYPGPLGVSLAGKALQEGRWRLTVIDMRTFGLGKYGAVDDTAYGGGAGMVIRPDVVDKAVRAAHDHVQNPTYIYMTPRGTPLTQNHCAQWSQPPSEVIILCGRYEGVDERVLQFWNFVPISLGDFVLCGGDIPAFALLEGCVRLLPGVLGNPQSARNESFQSGLLEHPLYTRPAVWQGLEVPEVLLSGHHKAIADWQKQKALEDTSHMRPDLLDRCD
jgi:tRNA (guanine37-N1)-methyltransferase